MSVTAAAKSKMLLDYMVSCIICILLPFLCLSFSWCTGKKKTYLKWDVSNLYFPCFIRRRKQICFVGAAAPAQWQINSSSFDITVHIIISSTNGRGLTPCVLARTTWQRAGTSLLPAEMLQEVSVERGWGSGGGTGPPFPVWHGYRPPALGLPQPFGPGTALCTPDLCAGWSWAWMDTGQAQQERARGCSHLGESQNALGSWSSSPGTPSLLLSHKVGTKHPQGWAHWRAWGKVCKEKPQGWKELLSNTSGMGSAPGIQVWEQLQSRSYSPTSTPSQARKRGTVL